MVSFGRLHTQAERTGLVIRHQQLTPDTDPETKTSLYSGYALEKFPDVELHADTPDIILPFCNVAVHVSD